MKRPLLVIALMYAAGLLLSKAASLPLALLFGASFIFSAASLVHFRARPICLSCAVVLCGWTNVTFRTAVLSPFDLRRIMGEAPELATIRGTLRGTPERRADERDSEIIRRSVAEVEVTGIKTRTKTMRASGRVIVNTPGVLDEAYFGGRIVEIYGILRRPKRPVAIGLFDYREYLRLRGIHYQLVTEGVHDWRLIDAGDPDCGRPLSDRFLAWARSNLSQGLGEEDETVRLVWAMVLGWRASLTDEVSERFMRSGTLHVFAISGLHIALITGILVRLLRALQVPRAATGLVLIPALWFYAFVTGWQASAVRATIMMTVVIAGWALNRPSDLVNSLAAAALIILVWDPPQLFQASFQLSFCVVLSIALLAPPLNKLRQRLLEPDPFLPRELRTPWQKRADRLIYYASTSFVVSAAAWLGSAPLIATYFHLVTPISLAANVAIVPLAALTLMSSLGSLLCGGVLPWLTVLFNHGAWFWMTSIVTVCDRAAVTPFAYLYTKAPSFPLSAAYYGALWACLSGWAAGGTYRSLRISGLSVLLITGAVELLRTPNSVELTVFPFGGGALFFDAKGSAQDLLIDCGDQTVAERVLDPYLRSKGVNRLPRLLLTHGDIRHVGGFKHLSQEFGKFDVITSPVTFRSAAYRQIENQLEKTPERWRRVSRGDTVAGWKVAHPAPEDRYARADDGAMVLLGEFHGLRILLLSDLGRLGQRRILEREDKLTADIVICGWPARDEALTEPLLRAIRPRLLIVASGVFPASNNVPRDARARLDAYGIPVLYTDRIGAVTITVSGEGWEARTPDGLAAFGDRHAEFPTSEGLGGFGAGSDSMRGRDGG